MRQHCDVLGLNEHATEQELKTRYRQLVKQWHPDRFANDPRKRAHAEANLKLINLAYRAIRNHRRMAGVGDASANRWARDFRTGSSTNDTSEPRSTDQPPAGVFQSEVTLTYLPAVVFVLFLTRHLEVIPPEALPFAVAMLVMSWTIMVWDVLHNQRVPANRRVLWIFLLIAVAAVSAPIYFRRYVRSPEE